ncbi:MAG TPA: GntR family transcriptional regulator [Acidimicrobiales bacterium]|nr:GntR family transcriptional regulator [Acidimicrobiales bacterium]
MQPERFRRVHRRPQGQREHASRRLRDVLRSNIYWGAYPRGFLPSDSELMVAYGASRASVREALNMLRHEGVIDRQQGTGTFVISHTASMQIREAHGVSRPDQESILEHHHTSEIDRSRVPIPDIVAKRLEAEPGEICLRLEYVSLHDGDVVGLATNYVLDPEATAIGNLPLGPSWYELLGRSGLTIGESELIIGCADADEHTASLLTVETGSAIFTIEQIIRDSRGRLYNFAYIVSRGDRNHIVSLARQEQYDDASR